VSAYDQRMCENVQGHIYIYCYIYICFTKIYVMVCNLLEGKKGIIFGALNDKSLAWKVAEKAYEQGARFTLKIIMQNLYHDGGFSSMGMSREAMIQYDKSFKPGD